jgi:hypothetical protein
VGRRIDFFGRSVPFQPTDDVESAIRRWLKSGRKGSSPWYLAQKAVVGAYPEAFLGEVLWVNPELG